MPVYDFKSIQAVPDAKELVDIILYKTQRKTPTVVRKQFRISRIRAFYMLKVRYTQSSIDAKLGQILDDFPKVDEIHPFYRYWFNVLYDKDHYKIALGQLHQCRTLVDKVGKHYVKLLKHADSLYQCKSLKRAALGRMVTLLRKQAPYLAYLEQIRQHMGRLPSIDPSTRSLLLTGYPSVGKSSLLNYLTKADVEVQPWAFTTRSLYVGHTKYKLLQYQVIDTPGLLDHPLEERNNIELQGITALAYLNSAIFFLLDPTVGLHFLQKQASLFESLKPFFQGKPVLIVLSKCDAWTLQDLSPEECAVIQSLSPGVPLAECVQLGLQPGPSDAEAEEAMHEGGEVAVQMQARLDAEQSLRTSLLAKQTSGPLYVTVSVNAPATVDRAKALGCELLLRVREASLLTQSKQRLLANRQYVAQPRPRDNRPRPATIPPSVLALQQAHVPLRPLTLERDGFESERDRELANGGPSVYSPDERRNWQLANEDWKYDPIPLFYNGKNIMDYIPVDGDIDEKLRQLEREEEELIRQQAGYDDTELFARLAAYQKATLNVPTAKRIVKGQEAIGKSLSRSVYSTAKRNTSKLDRFVRAAMAERGVDYKPRISDPGACAPMTSIMPHVFKRGHNSIQREKSLEARMVELASRNSMSVERLKEDMRAEQKVPADKRFHYQEPAATKPKHLMTGHMSLGTRDWR